MGVLGGFWVEGDGLDFRIEEMGCLTEFVGDEGVGLLASRFRGVPKRVSREAKSFSPSADSFSLSASEVSP